MGLVSKSHNYLNRPRTILEPTMESTLAHRNLQTHRATTLGTICDWIQSQTPQAAPKAAALPAASRSSTPKLFPKAASQSSPKLLPEEGRDGPGENRTTAAEWRSGTSTRRKRVSKSAILGNFCGAEKRSLKSKNLLFLAFPKKASFGLSSELVARWTGILLRRY